MIIKCKMCGGDLIIQEGNPICECEFCGSQQTVPQADNEKKINLFNRANYLRMNAEFDKAAAVYESIVAEFPSEAEAYWGLCLCSYGIEYVDDPATGEKKPTCHRTLPASIMENSNFEQACDYADGVARRTDREEAKAIDRIQQDILQIVANEEPYDVFICYKETAEEGGRTEDSVLAQDIYDALTEKGLKVFFSRITLEDKLGEQYEPYIYAALSSAKVMLAIGTKFEYYDAVWVKNEWMRFLSMMKSDKGKTLIPCYKDLDAYDMPKEFKSLQGQDMGKIGWLQDLTRGVLKLCGKNESGRSATQVVSTASPTVQSLLERGFIQLEDGLWDNATKQFNEILNIDPKCASAYFGMALIDLKIPNKEGFKQLYIQNRISDNRNLDRARQFDTTGEFKKWFNELDELQVDYESHIIERKIRNVELLKNRVGGYDNMVYSVRSNGTVNIAADPEYEDDVALCNEVKKWKDIIQFALGYERYYAVGLTKQGKVLAAGDNSQGQCDVDTWTDIVAIAASEIYPTTIGLKSDGTVVATGNNEFGQCDVSGWSDIKKIYIGQYYTAGIKTDGTVVVAGDLETGYEEWTDIVSLSLGNETLIGLKSDGTIVACGYQSELIENWCDIISISQDGSCIAGIKADGTIIGVSNLPLLDINTATEGWKDIVQIEMYLSRVYGLKADGTMLQGGDKMSGSDVSDWKDIVSFVYRGGGGLIGIRADGTLVKSGTGMEDVDISHVKADIPSII